MYFLIGADLVPTNSNSDLFISADIESLIGKELKELFEEAAFRLFNLEVPLTDVLTPIPKCGPNLVSSAECVNGYKAMGIDALTLANNHILDQGEQGLDSTISLLTKSGIRFFGAGKNVDEASKPLYFDFAGKKIGVIGYCQHEFSVATENRGGANLFDPIDSFDCIGDVSRQCDYLVVLYHGGMEHYRYPTPYLQKISRKMIEKGASLVVCQHSHCVGTIEEYLDGTIVYGQGNFLFDHQNNEFWATGILIKIDDNFDITYLPIQKVENRVRIAEESVSDEVLKGLAERTEEIKQNGFIKKKFDEFSEKQVNSYLGMFGGNESVIYRGLNKLLNNSLRRLRVKSKYKNTQRLMLRNYIECEAHREVIIAGLEK